MFFVLISFAFGSQLNWTESLAKRLFRGSVHWDLPLESHTHLTNLLTTYRKYICTYYASNERDYFSLVKDKIDCMINLTQVKRNEK